MLELKQLYIKSSVTWLPWLSTMNNRDRLYRTQVCRMKTVFNHYTATSSDIQPFGEFSNFQSLNSSIPSSGNYCCYISLPLKMTNGCRCWPLTETYSMIVVYSHRPGSFLKVLRFSTMPNTRP